MYNASYDNIPPQILLSLNYWACGEVSRYHGSFVQAVLTNDLYKSLAFADSASREALPSIVSYLYNRLPSGCWGSVDTYDAWYEEGPGCEEGAPALKMDLNDPALVWPKGSEPTQQQQQVVVVS